MSNNHEHGESGFDHGVYKIENPSSFPCFLLKVGCSTFYVGRLFSVLGPLHLSREIYKSHLFMQNKANLYHGLPARGLLLSPLHIECYINIYPVILSGNDPKNKAKQSQFKPNFSPILALFLLNEPNFKANYVKIGKFDSPLRNEILTSEHILRGWCAASSVNCCVNLCESVAKIFSVPKSIISDNLRKSAVNNISCFADLQTKNADHSRGRGRFCCNIVFLLTLTKRMRKRSCGRVKLACNARIKEQIYMSTPKSAEYPVILSENLCVLRGLCGEIYLPMTAMLNAFSEFGGYVGFFPGEVWQVSAEMAAMSSVKINGSVQLQIINHRSRREREKLPYKLTYLFLAYLRGPFGINQHRYGLSDTDCVRELDFAGVCKAGSDDILRDVAGHIARGPVNLRGVFSAETAAAMASSAAVGIDDDFPSCQAAIGIRAAIDEPAGRVYVVNDFFIDEFFRQNGQNDFFDDLFSQVFVLYRRVVLSRNDDCVDTLRFSIFIFHGYLAFTIRSEPGKLFRKPCLFESQRKGLCERDRKRHKRRGFSAGVTEHNTLVTGTLFFVQAGAFVDALSDVEALLFDVDEDCAAFIVETNLRAGVTDFSDCIADDIGNVDG